MRNHRFRPSRSGQRGQTLLLVAIMLGALISMAALAIDLTNLYVARGEVQRAADAAALAGAKAFVESGTTTAPLDTNLQNLASLVGNAYVNTILQQNKVNGAVPQLASAPTFNFARRGNPQITVSLQRTDVPTFFARIFGRTVATVKASATAEAYNSSLPPGGAGNMPPIAPACVKPWMIVNIDPNDHGAGTNRPFVNADGSLASPNVGPWIGPGTGVIGEQITLNNSILGSLIPILVNPGYLPAKLDGVSGACSACAGGSNFSQSAACCDTTNTYSCAGTKNYYYDILNNGIFGLLDGAACLLTGGGSGSGTVGLDRIDFSQFKANPQSSPIEIQSGSGPMSGRYVNTSGQIVTVPIIDAHIVSLITGQVKIIGFMQVFIESTQTGGGITMDVLNISGCGTNINTGATPVGGEGSSSVPVRLIH